MIVRQNDRDILQAQKGVLQKAIIVSHSLTSRLTSHIADYTTVNLGVAPMVYSLQTPIKRSYRS